MQDYYENFPMKNIQSKFETIKISSKHDIFET